MKIFPTSKNSSNSNTVFTGNSNVFEPIDSTSSHDEECKLDRKIYLFDSALRNCTLNRRHSDSHFRNFVTIQTAQICTANNGKNEDYAADQSRRDNLNVGAESNGPLSSIQLRRCTCTIRIQNCSCKHCKHKEEHPEVEELYSSEAESSNQENSQVTCQITEPTGSSQSFLPDSFNNTATSIEIQAPKSVPPARKKSKCACELRIQQCASPKCKGKEKGPKEQVIKDSPQVRQPKKETGSYQPPVGAHWGTTSTKIQSPGSVSPTRGKPRCSCAVRSEKCGSKNCKGKEKLPEVPSAKETTQSNEEASVKEDQRESQTTFCSLRIESPEVQLRQEISQPTEEIISTQTSELSNFSTAGDTELHLQKKPPTCGFSIDTFSSKAEINSNGDSQEITHSINEARSNETSVHEYFGAKIQQKSVPAQYKPQLPEKRQCCSNKAEKKDTRGYVRKDARLCCHSCVCGQKLKIEIYPDASVSDFVCCASANTSRCCLEKTLTEEIFETSSEESDWEKKTETGSSSGTDSSEGGCTITKHNVSKVSVDRCIKKKDSKFASGQLTSGIVPTELRASIHCSCCPLTKVNGPKLTTKNISIEQIEASSKLFQSKIGARHSKESSPEGSRILPKNNTLKRLQGGTIVCIKCANEDKAKEIVKMETGEEAPKIMNDSILQSDTTNSAPLEVPQHKIEISPVNCCKSPIMDTLQSKIDVLENTCSRLAKNTPEIPAVQEALEPCPIFPCNQSLKKGQPKQLRKIQGSTTLSIITKIESQNSMDITKPAKVSEDMKLSRSFKTCTPQRQTEIAAVLKIYQDKIEQYRKNCPSSCNGLVVKSLQNKIKILQNLLPRSTTNLTSGLQRCYDDQLAQATKASKTVTLNANPTFATYFFVNKNNPAEDSNSQGGANETTENERNDLTDNNETETNTIHYDLEKPCAPSCCDETVPKSTEDKINVKSKIDCRNVASSDKHDLDNGPCHTKHVITLKSLEDQLEAYKKLCPPSCDNTAILKSIETKIKALKNEVFQKTASSTKALGSGNISKNSLGKSCNSFVTKEKIGETTSLSKNRSSLTNNRDEAKSVQDSLKPTSDLQVCPENCDNQITVCVKTVQDKIEPKESCPQNCYDNPIVRSLHEKIEVLENALLQLTENSKQELQHHEDELSHKSDPKIVENNSITHTSSTSIKNSINSNISPSNSKTEANTEPESVKLSPLKCETEIAAMLKILQHKMELYERTCPAQCYVNPIFKSIRSKIALLKNQQTDPQEAQDNNENKLEQMPSDKINDNEAKSENLQSPNEFKGCETEIITALKLFQEKMEEFDKICPTKCYDNPIVRAIQSKIALLTNTKNASEAKLSTTLSKCSTSCVTVANKESKIKSLNSSDSLKDCALNCETEITAALRFLHEKIEQYETTCPAKCYNVNNPFFKSLQSKFTLLKNTKNDDHDGKDELDQISESQKHGTSTEHQLGILKNNPGYTSTSKISKHSSIDASKKNKTKNSSVHLKDCPITCETEVMAALKNFQDQMDQYEETCPTQCYDNPIVKSIQSQLALMKNTKNDNNKDELSQMPEGQKRDSITAANISSTENQLGILKHNPGYTSSSKIGKHSSLSTSKKNVPKTSYVRLMDCPMTCETDVMTALKHFQDKIEHYEKTCPKSCYDNPIVRPILSKIALLRYTENATEEFLQNHEDVLSQMSEQKLSEINSIIASIHSLTESKLNTLKRSAHDSLKSSLDLKECPSDCDAEITAKLQILQEELDQYAKKCMVQCNTSSSRRSNQLLVEDEACELKNSRGTPSIQSKNLSKERPALKSALDLKACRSECHTQIKAALEMLDDKIEQYKRICAENCYNNPVILFLRNKIEALENALRKNGAISKTKVQCNEAGGSTKTIETPSGLASNHSLKRQASHTLKNTQGSTTLSRTSKTGSKVLSNDKQVESTSNFSLKPDELNSLKNTHGSTSLSINSKKSEKSFRPTSNIKVCPSQYYTEIKNALKSLEDKIEEYENICGVNCLGNSFIKSLHTKIEALENVLTKNPTNPQLECGYQDDEAEAQKILETCLSLACKPSLREDELNTLKNTRASTTLSIKSKTEGSACPSQSHTKIKAALKILEDKMDHYEKVCAVNCYDNPLVKSLQNKIEALEAALITNTELKYSSQFEPGEFADLVSSIPSVCCTTENERSSLKNTQGSTTLSIEKGMRRILDDILPEDLPNALKNTRGSTTLSIKSKTESRCPPCHENEINTSDHRLQEDDDNILKNTQGSTTLSIRSKTESRDIAGSDKNLDIDFSLKGSEVGMLKNSRGSTTLSIKSKTTSKTVTSIEKETNSLDYGVKPSPDGTCSPTCQDEINTFLKILEKYEDNNCTCQNPVMISIQNKIEALENALLKNSPKSKTGPPDNYGDEVNEVQGEFGTNSSFAFSYLLEEDDPSTMRKIQGSRTFNTKQKHEGKETRKTKETKIKEDGSPSKTCPECQTEVTTAFKMFESKKEQSEETNAKTAPEKKNIFETTSTIASPCVFEIDNTNTMSKMQKKAFSCLGMNEQRIICHSPTPITPATKIRQHLEKQSKTCPDVFSKTPAIQSLQNKVQPTENTLWKNVVDYKHEVLDDTNTQEEATILKSPPEVQCFETSSNIELKQSLMENVPLQSSKMDPVQCTSQIGVALNSLQGKLQQYQKTCPTDCYENPAVTIIQNKIKELENALSKNSLNKNSVLETKASLALGYSLNKVGSNTLSKASNVKTSSSESQTKATKVQSQVKEACPSTCCSEVAIKRLEEKVVALEKALVTRNSKSELKSDRPALMEGSVGDKGQDVEDGLEEEAEDDEEQEEEDKISNNEDARIIDYNLRCQSDLTSCAADCRNAAVLKILQDKIKAYERTCPSKCYNSAVVKRFQNKIAALENIIREHTTDVNDATNSKSSSSCLSKVDEVDSSEALKEDMKQSIGNLDSSNGAVIQAFAQIEQKHQNTILHTLELAPCASKNASIQTSCTPSSNKKVKSSNTSSENTIDTTKNTHTSKPGHKTHKRHRSSSEKRSKSSSDSQAIAVTPQEPPQKDTFFKRKDRSVVSWCETDNKPIEPTVTSKTLDAKLQEVIGTSTTPNKKPHKDPKNTEPKNSDVKDKKHHSHRSSRKKSRNETSDKETNSMEEKSNIVNYGLEPSSDLKFKSLYSPDLAVQGVLQDIFELDEVSCSPNYFNNGVVESLQNKNESCEMVCTSTCCDPTAFESLQNQIEALEKLIEISAKKPSKFEPALSPRRQSHNNGTDGNDYFCNYYLQLPLSESKSLDNVRPSVNPNKKTSNRSKDDDSITTSNTNQSSSFTPTTSTVKSNVDNKFSVTKNDRNGSSGKDSSSLVSNTSSAKSIEGEKSCSCKSPTYKAKSDKDNESILTSNTHQSTDSSRETSSFTSTASTAKSNKHEPSVTFSLKHGSESSDQETSSSISSASRDKPNEENESTISSRTKKGSSNTLRKTPCSTTLSTSTNNGNKYLNYATQTSEVKTCSSECQITATKKTHQEICPSTCCSEVAIKRLEEKIVALEKALFTSDKPDKKETKNSNSEQDDQLDDPSTHFEQNVINNQQGIEVNLEEEKDNFEDERYNNEGTRILDYNLRCRSELTSCAADCRTSAVLKILQDKIKAYERSCPSKCYDSALLKRFQDKIAVLERISGVKSDKDDGSNANTTNVSLDKETSAYRAKSNKKHESSITSRTSHSSGSSRKKTCSIISTGFTVDSNEHEPSVTSRTTHRSRNSGKETSASRDKPKQNNESSITSRTSYNSGRPNKETSSLISSASKDKPNEDHEPSISSRRSHNSRSSNKETSSLISARSGSKSNEHEPSVTSGTTHRSGSSRRETSSLISSASGDKPSEEKERSITSRTSHCSRSCSKETSSLKSAGSRAKSNEENEPSISSRRSQNSRSPNKETSSLISARSITKSNENEPSVSSSIKYRNESFGKETSSSISSASRDKPNDNYNSGSSDKETSSLISARSIAKSIEHEPSVTSRTTHSSGSSDKETSSKRTKDSDAETTSDVNSIKKPKQKPNLKRTSRSTSSDKDTKDSNLDELQILRDKLENWIETACYPDNCSAIEALRNKIDALEMAASSNYNADIIKKLQDKTEDLEKTCADLRGIQHIQNRTEEFGKDCPRSCSNADTIGKLQNKIDTLEKMVIHLRNNPRDESSLKNDPFRNDMKFLQNKLNFCSLENSSPKTDTNKKLLTQITAKKFIFLKENALKHEKSNKDSKPKNTPRKINLLKRFQSKTSSKCDDISCPIYKPASELSIRKSSGKFMQSKNKKPMSENASGSKSKFFDSFRLRPKSSDQKLKVLRKSNSASRSTFFKSLCRIHSKSGDQTKIPLETSNSASKSSFFGSLCKFYFKKGDCNNKSCPKRSKATTVALKEDTSKKEHVFPIERSGEEMLVQRMCLAQQYGRIAKISDKRELPGGKPYVSSDYKNRENGKQYKFFKNNPTVLYCSVSHKNNMENLSITNSFTPTPWNDIFLKYYMGSLNAYSDEKQWNRPMSKIIELSASDSFTGYTKLLSSWDRYAKNKYNNSQLEYCTIYEKNKKKQRLKRRNNHWFIFIVIILEFCICQ